MSSVDDDWIRLARVEVIRHWEVKMGLPTLVRLTPGRWIRLPGTSIEVYLRGKYQDRGPIEWVRWREDEATGAGYWDLSRVYPRLYVRGVDIFAHPTTMAEAVRPPAVRPPLRRPERYGGEAAGSPE